MLDGRAALAMLLTVALLALLYICSHTQAVRASSRSSLLGEAADSQQKALIEHIYQKQRRQAEADLAALQPWDFETSIALRDEPVSSTQHLAQELHLLLHPGISSGALEMSCFGGLCRATRANSYGISLEQSMLFQMPVLAWTFTNLVADARCGCSYNCFLRERVGQNLRDGDGGKWVCYCSQRKDACPWITHQTSVLEPHCRYVEFRPCCSARTV